MRQNETIFELFFEWWSIYIKARGKANMFRGRKMCIKRGKMGKMRVLHTAKTVGKCVSELDEGTENGEGIVGVHFSIKRAKTPLKTLPADSCRIEKSYDF
jgi:hypothetical protein